MISAFRYGLKFTLGAILVFMICYQLNRLRTLADIRSQDLSIGGLRPGLSLQEMQAIRGPCKPVSGPGLERIEPFVIYDFPEDDCRVYLREGHISHILGYTLVLAAVAVGAGYTSLGGPAYVAVAVVLNIAFIKGAVDIWRRDETDSEADDFKVERRFFKWSLAYLFLHFCAILTDPLLAELVRGAL